MKKIIFLITAFMLIIILNIQNKLIICQDSTKNVQANSEYDNDSTEVDWKKIESRHVDSLLSNIEQIIINGNAFFEKENLIINLRITNNTRDIISISLAQWFFGSNPTDNDIPGSIHDMHPTSQITIFNRKYYYPTAMLNGDRDFLFKKIPFMARVYQHDSLTIRIKKRFNKNKYLSDTIKYHVFIHLYYAKSRMLSEYLLKHKLGIPSANSYGKRLIEINIDKDGNGIFDTGIYSTLKLNKHNAEVLNAMFRNEAYGLIDIE